ncbi:MAG: 50S ribosomal protein L6 [Legionellaceae bacterium]|nr:50S ribosomal protein L6 [Legionellaceae bacterium]
MSRVAKSPIKLPQGVTVSINAQQVSVKGAKGELQHRLHPLVDVSQEADVLHVKGKSVEKLSRSQMPRKDAVNALSGATRSLVNNMVIGVSTGFVKKLRLVGVGYRAQVQGNKLVLSLGFSHPVEYALPEGIQAKTPSQTEIEIEGINKQLVGQVAAEVRSFRPPEPYKGKGVRYHDEVVLLKETKKK